MRTYQILCITLDIFKRYLKEQHDLTDEHIKDLSNICKTSIENCINDTIDHCLTDDNKIGREFINEILLGIYQEDIVSADFAEYSKEAKKARKNKYLQRYVFYFDGSYLCVEADILTNWLKTRLELEVVPSKQKVSAANTRLLSQRTRPESIISYTCKDRKNVRLRSPIYRRTKCIMAGTILQDLLIMAVGEITRTTVLKT